MYDDKYYCSINKQTNKQTSTKSTTGIQEEVETLRRENSELKTECRDLQDILKEHSLDMEDLEVCCYVLCDEMCSHIIKK